MTELIELPIVSTADLLNLLILDVCSTPSFTW